MLPEYHDIYHKDEEGKKYLAGRLAFIDGESHVLSDYHDDMLSAISPPGHSASVVREVLKRLPSHLQAVSHDEFRRGKHLDMVPEMPLDKPLEPTTTPGQGIPHVAGGQLPPSVFHYHRVGMDNPHIVEFHGKQATLDGNPIHEGHLKLMLENHRKGVATIRYHRREPNALSQSIKKMESQLKKAFDETGDKTQAAANKIRALVQAGHLTPEEGDYHLNLMFGDPMADGMGNKRAYEAFKAQKKPGVYVMMDGNDFKQVNDRIGYEAGDASIRSFGKLIRESVDEAVGRDKAKTFHAGENPSLDQGDAFRAGGDEFTVHMPSHEHAAKFARLLSSKLDQIPPVVGNKKGVDHSHKLSMSMGFGMSPEHAETALNHAKGQKFHDPEGKVRKWDVGKTPSLAHSLVPGFEGPVPLSAEHVPFQPPKPEELAPKAPKVPAPKPMPTMAEPEAGKFLEGQGLKPKTGTTPAA